MPTDLEAMMLGVTLVAWVMWAYQSRSGDLRHDIRALQDSLADHAAPCR
jgi:hypothetical protein